jgi:hypothetical protein
MAISEALRRLLGLRTLEEEQHKLALESALGELHRLKSALAATRMRERSGRLQLAAAARSQDVSDRIAGLVECESARRNAQILEIYLKEAARRAAELRGNYLTKRIERRQVETVIHEAEALETVLAVRHDQQRMDDWFTARLHAAKTQHLNSEDREMKSLKEIGSVPERQLRSNV